jgi:transcriptional regulator with XRE-family HTH domain
MGEDSAVRQGKRVRAEQKAQEPWRKFLREVFTRAGEKERIATALGVAPATLVRWTEGMHDPKPQQLLELRNALPEDRREAFVGILERMPEMQEYADTLRELVLPSIPGPVYRRIIDAHAASGVARRFFDVATVILQQAIAQLDPGKLGMCLSIVRCMASSQGEPIRSLRQSISIGTAPWPEPVDPNGSVFMGAESLAGHVVTTTFAQIIENVDDPYGPLPLHRESDALEKSLAIFPILREGTKTAGCLMACSTQPYYFQQNHRDLLAAYASCCELAFDPSEFYDPQQIMLRELPSRDIQRTYAVRLPQWTAEAIRLAGRKGEHITSAAAQQIAWLRLEAALLEHSLSEHEPVSEPVSQREP